MRRSCNIDAWTYVSWESVFSPLVASSSTLLRIGSLEGRSGGCRLPLRLTSREGPDRRSGAATAGPLARDRDPAKIRKAARGGVEIPFQPIPRDLLDYSRQCNRSSARSMRQPGRNVTRGLPTPVLVRIKIPPSIAWARLPLVEPVATACRGGSRPTCPSSVRWS
jgi:hypothetical protein